MRKLFQKFAIISSLLSVAIIFIFSFALNPSVSAAPPDTPGQTVLNQVAEEAGLSLEKVASSETIALGHPVTYTVTIKNDRETTVQYDLSDDLPLGLALQTKSVSATVGVLDVSEGVVSWVGEVPAGKTVSLFYAAIPPSTSDVGQTLDNVAVLVAGSTTLEAKATVTTESPNLGMWGRFVNLLAWILVATDTLLEEMGVPYAFGFAIILFTVVVRLATFPLNMQQIKSSKAMQELQPQMKEIQAKYKDDKEKLAQEQMKLYKDNGVNPLGGCLPMLVQMPIWFALYRALIQLSSEGLLNKGFFWLPSLSGPVSDWGGGIEWLWPLPPSVGWPDALAYMVLPVLLIVSQLYMQQMMTPPTTDPQQQSMQSVMKFMPFMFGYFALIVPSGLTLYWFTSNLLALVQQYFTKTQLAPSSPEKKSAIGSTPIPESVAIPANSTPAMSTGEGRKNQNAKSKRKRRKH